MVSWQHAQKASRTDGEDQRSFPLPPPPQGSAGFMAQWTRPQAGLQDNHPAVNLENDRRFYATLAAIIIIGATGTGLAAYFLSWPVAFMVAGLSALCGLFTYDWRARQRWERAMTRQINVMSETHERLVRDVARSRADITIIKDEISTMAHSAGQPPLQPHSAAPQNVSPPPAPKAMPARPQPVNGLYNIRRRDDIKNLSDTEMNALLHGAIQHERIEAFVQPVCSLPNRKPRLFELQSRLRLNGGNYMTAQTFIAHARDHDLLSAIDHTMLRHGLRMISQRLKGASPAPATSYILNITEQTLRDPVFSHELVTFLARHKDMARQLIFEFTQADYENLHQSTKALLEGLGQLGCRFALDHVKNLRLDPRALRRDHIAFVKIPAAAFATHATTDQGHQQMMALRLRLEQAGIAVIVEKIESEAMMREILDFDINYGQGWLLGKPDYSHAYRRKQTKRAA